MAQTNEKAFETAIECHLTAVGDYAKSGADAFDRDRCLDPGVFLSFIRETRPKEWA